MHPIPDPPGLVIFDCDGVLVDSEYLANGVLAGKLSELGLPTTVEESIGRYTGMSMATVYASVAETLGRPVPEGFPEEVDAATFEVLRHELEAVEGIHAVLRDLRVPCAIATSGGPAKYGLSLRVAGLWPFFAGRVIVDSTMVRHGKPAPDLFLLAAERAGVDPGTCVVIEDSTRGIEAALAGHMAVLGFTGGRHMVPEQCRRIEAMGVPTFTRMTDLPRLIPGAFRDEVAA